MNKLHNNFERRVALFTFVIIACICGLAWRIWTTTHLSKSDFASRRAAYIDHLRSTPGMAGAVTDRNGQPLAIDRTGRNGRLTRIYPLGEVAASVIGFVTPYSPPVGLERWRLRHDLPSPSLYDHLLGDPVFALGATSDLKLTIDSALQRECYQALLREECPGTVVLMSFDGEILAMASTPSWNPNQAMGQKDGPYRRSLSEYSLRNRAVAPIAPGSAIKPLLYLLAKGHGNWPSEYTCRGVAVVAGQRIRCNAVHGRITWQTAIIQSCDSRAATLAADEFTSLDIHDGFARLGLGSSDVEGIGAIHATLLDASAPTEKRTYVGIGNAIAIPPLSLLRVYAAIGNHGLAPTPHMLFDQKPKLEALFPRSDADEMATVLRQVVSRGTARSAKRWQILGKTGTNRLHARLDEEQGGLFVWVDERARVAGIVVLEGTSDRSFKSRDAVKLVDRMYASFLNRLPHRSGGQ